QHSYFTTRSEIIGEEIDDEAKIHDVNLLMQNVELQDLNQEFILPNFQPPSRGLGEIEFFQPAAELSLKKLDFTLVLNEWNLCWASVISVIGIKDNITAKDKLTDGIGELAWQIKVCRADTVSGFTCLGSSNDSEFAHAIFHVLFSASYNVEINLHEKNYIELLERDKLK
ncbi:705_t:CDS:2, partial [Entrophospora sp. SA101]